MLLVVISYFPYCWFIFSTIILNVKIMHWKFPVVWLFLIFYYWWCRNEQLCTKSLFLLLNYFLMIIPRSKIPDQRQEHFSRSWYALSHRFPNGAYWFWCHLPRVSSSFCGICELPRYNIPYCSNWHAVDRSAGRRFLVSGIAACRPLLIQDALCLRRLSAEGYDPWPSLCFPGWAHADPWGRHCPKGVSIQSHPNMTFSTFFVFLCF